MSTESESEYVGRGGWKLKAALDHWDLGVGGCVAADFGCNIGGFTDCLLKEGARRVYAVDTGYGALDWKLRNDQRVVVMERTNAMHVRLAEPVDVVTVDVAWTRQRHILPNALTQAKPDGFILSLFKPQYEADPSLVRHGLIKEEDFDSILAECLEMLEQMGIVVADTLRLPRPRQSKNPECMFYILSADCALKPRFRPQGPRGG